MKSKEIVGKQVVSIRDGGVLGRIRCPVIDGTHQIIVGFIVDDEEWFLETKVVLFQFIRGLEEEVVTVDDGSVILPVKGLEKIHSYLKENLQLVNTKVITESGKQIGKVEDFLFNSRTGKIEGYKLESKHTVLDWREALALGREMVIVKEETAAEVYQDKAESYSDVDLSALFEKRQVEFLIGKQLMRDVRDEEGEVILGSGSVISRDAIHKVKSMGKFTELLMSVEAEE
ncbi:MAG: hypothetical protein GF333_05115 [Candidatus Omnitrophica bacterium]|nr:hypothetical protein [Candidatus Omnitrophota bacterium]